MKNYYRVMLGKKSKFAKEGYEGNFIGADYNIDLDLTNHLPDNWRDFNKEFIPIFFEKNSENKNKISAGLACGMLWTIAKGITEHDIVLSPNGTGNYYIGEIIGNYEYHKGQILPHRRGVKWFQKIVSKDELSESLRHSIGSIGTVSNISKHSKEIETLLAGNKPPSILSTDETVEKPSEFALEEHLEDFLVKNWKETELGSKYNIFEENGKKGQQYPTDTGEIDILAISKDKKIILVIELKKGRASDVVVGQVQRYMGFVKEELAEKDQIVRGLIIAFEDDLKIKRALSIAKNIDFLTYKIKFKLEGNLHEK